MMLLFWLSSLFIAYTYFVYPALIFLLCRIAGKTPLPGNETEDLPEVTLIIVVFNEEKRVPLKLTNCRELDYPDGLLTVCFVSDGSQDGTAGLLRDLDDIVFIEDDNNHGKPYQINRAMEQCRSEIAVFSDVRQMFKPDALRKLARNFKDPGVGVVSGELTFRTSGDPTGENIGLYWKYEKFLRKAESCFDSTVGVTGAIYAMRRELFTPIPKETILDDVEIPLGALRQGYRIIFEPEAIAYDNPVEDIGSEFQRKVRTLTGNFQLFSTNAWLLNPFKNRIFLQAVSHKLMRLFIPYALLLVLISSLSAEGGTMKALVVLQIAFYAAGTLAIFHPGARRFRLLNFMAVFISMNAAAVAALLRFLFGTVDARWRA